ncbi:MAG: hypothetical protein ACI9MF_001554, partial [Gammaproteobacteria bacterium]
MDFYISRVRSGIRRFLSALVHEQHINKWSGLTICLLMVISGGCAIQAPVSDDAKT